MCSSEIKGIMIRFSIAEGSGAATKDIMKAEIDQEIIKTEQAPQEWPEMCNMKTIKHAD